MMYNYPPPGAYRYRNGLGTASLTLGIISVVVGFLPYVGVTAFVLGVIAMTLGLANTTRVSKRMANNPTATTFGVLTGVAGIILGTIGFIILMQGLDQVQSNLEDGIRDIDKRQECVDESQDSRELEECLN